MWSFSLNVEQPFLGRPFLATRHPSEAVGHPSRASRHLPRLLGQLSRAMRLPSRAVGPLSRATGHLSRLMGLQNHRAVGHICRAAPWQPPWPSSTVLLHGFR